MYGILTFYLRLVVNMALSRLIFDVLTTWFVLITSDNGSYKTTLNGGLDFQNELPIIVL